MSRDHDVDEGLVQIAKDMAAQKREEITKLVAEKIDSDAYSLEKLFVRELQEIFLIAIGFEHRWNEISVDHCNGRKTAIADEISFALRKQVTELLKKLDIDRLVADQMKELKKAVIKEIKQDNRYVIEKAITEAIGKKMDDYIAAHVDDLITDDDCKTMLANYFDPCDHDSDDSCDYDLDDE